MMPFFRKSESEACRRYLTECRRRVPGKTSLSDLRFVVIDTETSGFKVGKDRILSLALFEIVDGRIDLARGRKWIVFQPDITPTASTAIHGILPSEIRNGTLEQDLLEELIPLLSGAVVVGHHIRFDAAMMNEMMLRCMKTRFRNRIVDTAHMAMNELIPFHQTGYANQRPPSLDEVCAQLDLPVIARHTAEGDAFVTAEVFLMLCGRIRRRLAGPPQIQHLPIRKF
jgi:DNA polymerase-3 subunit epsilon